MNIRGLLSITLATVLLSPTVSLASTEAADQAVDKIGVFRGSGKPDQVAEYEKWLGKPMNYVVDFVGRTSANSTNPWTKIDNPAWWCNQWKGRSSTLVLSTAMLPNKNFTLTAGARGEYNDHWQKFGKTLVDRGCQDAILRLGWEFNGKFYPWVAGGKEASFAAYWRQIVDTLRKVPNQQFLFDWCPLAGVKNANVEAAWPGTNYVDIIGLDAYDTTTTQDMNDPAKRWANQLSRPYGLNWLASFAESQRKPMSFPEWGVTNRPNDNLGGGDNPSYITNMWQWINTHNVKYTTYFEDDTPVANHRLMTTEFPKASAEYRRLVRGGI